MRTNEQQMVCEEQALKQFHGSILVLNGISQKQTFFLMFKQGQFLFEDLKHSCYDPSVNTNRTHTNVSMLTLEGTLMLFSSLQRRF
jgi:hypothetical protein